jgi:hypothetical protein
MIKRLILVGAVAAGVLAPTAAFAEGAVGTPGEPTCYGLRVSTGSQTVIQDGGDTFRLTPVTRAMFNGISVQGFHDRVWAACQ